MQFTSNHKSIEYRETKMKIKEIECKKSWKFSLFM